MTTDPTASPTTQTVPAPPGRTTVPAWLTFLGALDELTARYAAARGRPYTRQRPAALAALAGDLAGTGLTPEQVACCAFAWPPTRHWRPADVAALAAESARPAMLLP